MSLDLTIESVLADPMIRAVMRADRVEPQAMERLLRTAAKNVERPRFRPAWAPKALVASQINDAVRGFCCA